MTHPPDAISGLLRAWGHGDLQARDNLLPLVYRELRRRATAYLRRERQEHTLQPTALVHELFIRLFDERKMNCSSRGHFFGVASKLMRRLLVDHARKKQAAKRSGLAQFNLDCAFTSLSPDAEVLAVDQALGRLESIDSRKAQVVERKFFGGMTNEETADSLAISVASVERDWCMARAWLFRELKGPAAHNGP